jgi:DNA-binding MarR family transcriptional regulator
LPLLLLSGFRSLIDELHAELAEQGHPDVRPMHGFLFQAVGPHGTTAADLGRALGISRQAVGKTVDILEGLGYLRREGDPNDGRRILIHLTDQGVDCLAESARIFDRLRQRWSRALGADRLRAMEADLRKVVPRHTRLDIPGWIGG